MPKHQSAGAGGSTLLGIEERRTRTAGASSALDRWLTRRILAESGQPPLTIELWDGTRIEPEPPPADIVARVEIRDRRTLYGLLVNTDVAFGDALSADRIRVHGDLVTLLETIYRSADAAIPRDSWKRRVTAWLNRPRRNSRSGSKSNIHHHYDIGNDFYRLWLDQEMVYTCAYYPREDATLEEAQQAKMDHVCRKLELRPGQHVVEAGCGWGALAIHMARDYGVHVRAFNISHEQIRYARKRAAALGLDGQVEFVEDDYRTVEGKYDAFVSVGMLEHVGVDNYRALGEVAARVLKSDGRGLIHSIGRNAPAPNNPWIERRIFPGSYPPSLSEMSVIFEPQEFSVLDIENLRLHYARTCRAWLERFETAADRVEAMYDSDFVRAWRLYLAGSVAAFTTGSLQLFQVVFAPGESNEVPMTRDHVYPRN
ncbi:MAG: cyclopropane-fatty-acyl-phospholipid synthase [Immundisolibacterales bacterium]|nr:cyclopropane-fatty-acyl-phospholipid synthase [Immundisolibacterales bacterium]